MKKKIFSWLGDEFMELSGESRPAPSVADETDDLFRRFESELKAHGLSLRDTVRTRIWGRDREARALATGARAKILTGHTKAASSSYISPRHFDSNARAALDLLAMRPSQAHAERIAVDFEPPRNYLCYLRYASSVFLSGYTSDADTLEDQVPQILRAVAGGLMVAASEWRHIIKLSFFLHRSEKLETLKALLEQTSPPPDKAIVEFDFVDGYAGDKSLLDVETAALIRR